MTEHKEIRIIRGTKLEEAIEDKIAPAWRDRYMAINRHTSYAKRGWNVTHIPTGLAVRTGVAEKRIALRLAKFFAKVCAELDIDLRERDPATFQKHERFKDLGAKLRDAFRNCFRRKVDDVFRSTETSHRGCRPERAP